MRANVTVTVAEKLSVLQTADFFAERAGQSKPEALALLLNQVKARVPLAGDEKPEGPYARLTRSAQCFSVNRAHLAAASRAAMPAVFHQQ